MVTPNQGINITGNTATGNFTFLDSHNDSTGIVAYNTMQGPFIKGGRNLEKNGNVRYEIPKDPVTGNPIDVNNRYFVGIPKKYLTKFSTKIIGFNPDNIIEINETSYGVSDSVVDFAKNKNKLIELANTEADFIYCKRNGKLFFNENQSQPGFGDGGVIALSLIHI